MLHDTLQHGLLDLADPEQAEALGREAGEIEGKSLISLLGAGSLKPKRWTQLLSGGDVQDLELELKSKSNKKKRNAKREKKNNENGTNFLAVSKQGK